MGNRRRTLNIRMVAACVSSILFVASAAAGEPATIRHVSLGSGGTELEIQASQPVKPQIQLITGPDRLVVDFPNALPGDALRGIAVSRGDVKSVRVGLFAKNPPITRVVLDLKSPQTYQLFPSGSTLLVKLGTNTSKPVVQPVSMPMAQAPAMPAAPPAKPEPKVEVRYENGRMSIWANRATLAEVLYEVHRKTGADVPIPAGAEQEIVVTSIGPAPVREVVASLLDGSQFNFIVVGSETDPGALKSLILTPQGQGSGSQPMITYTQPAAAQATPPSDPDAEQSGPSDPQPENQGQQTKDDATPPQ